MARGFPVTHEPTSWSLTWLGGYRFALVESNPLPWNTCTRAAAKRCIHRTYGFKTKLYGPKRTVHGFCELCLIGQVAALATCVGVQVQGEVRSR